MNILLAAPRTGRLRTDRTGEIYPEYRKSLRRDVTFLEQLGHKVCCPLLEQMSSDPSKALEETLSRLDDAEGLLAYIDPHVSAGVQTMIGFALARDKQIVIASSPIFTELPGITAAIIASGKAVSVPLSLDVDPFARN